MAKKKPIPDDCMPKCASCAFYVADKGEDFGECRRLPPVMVPEGDEYSFAFPIVNADDWHGVIMLHNVKDGEFDEMFVPLHYIKEKYSA